MPVVKDNSQHEPQRDPLLRRKERRCWQSRSSQPPNRQKRSTRQSPSARLELSAQDSHNTLAPVALFRDQEYSLWSAWLAAPSYRPISALSSKILPTIICY